MRALTALAAGLVIGVILIESISAGLAVLLPQTALYVEAADGYSGPVVWPLLPVPALIWLLGTLAGGAMAAAVGPRPAWGLAVGTLLAMPAFLLVGLITPGNPLALLAAALPVIGSSAGAVLVVRLQHESVTANEQAL